MSRALRVRRAALALAVMLAAAGAWQVAQAAWIHGKGLVAQALIARAWRLAERGGRPAAPWPGADHRALARLTLPTLRVTLHVLDTASPRALAFGPGHVPGSAAPGARGNTVIAAHRDTHFAALGKLRVGDGIELEAVGGVHVRYRVEEVGIVHQRDAEVLDAGGEPRLTLVTCYPFDAVRPGTPWRYVVVAGRVA